MNKSIFSNEVKNGDIGPIYKKESSEKEIYRSMLVFYQFYQKSLIFVYIINLIITLIRYYQCEFRKGFSTLHGSLAMIEKLQKVLTVGAFRCSFD